MKEYPKVLAIAGSEPLGSAGVQADIKSISACGSYAAGAITCIVDEDTTRVKQVFPLPVELVTGQVRSFLDDVHASAIKTGMLFTDNIDYPLHIEGDCLWFHPEEKTPDFPTYLQTI